MPVYPTIASQFNDPGISWMFVNLCRLLREKLGSTCRHGDATASPKLDTSLKEPRATVLIPGARMRYLAEIAEQGRAHQPPASKSRPKPPSRAADATGECAARTSATPSSAEDALALYEPREASLSTPQREADTQRRC